MKGAITEPCAKIISPPKTIIIIIKGANHNFFLLNKNKIISLKNSINTLLFRTDF